MCTCSATTSDSQTHGHSLNSSRAGLQARRGASTEGHARAPAAVVRQRDIHQLAQARAPARAKLPSIQATGSFVDGGLEQRYEAALDKAVVARQHGGTTFIRAVRSPELFSEARLQLAAPLHLLSAPPGGWDMIRFPSGALDNSGLAFELGSSDLLGARQVSLLRPNGGPYMGTRSTFSEGPGKGAAGEGGRAISPQPFRVASRAQDVFDEAVPLPVYTRGL
jgi:hypothetical protein